MNKEALLKDLFVDEAEEFKALVGKVKEVMKVTPSGKPIPLSDKKLTQLETVWLYVLARYLTKEAGKLQTDEISNKEIAQTSGIPGMQVGARLKELREMNLVENVRSGVHRVSFAKASEFLDSIISRTEE